MEKLIERQRKFFQQDYTKDYAFRKRQLERLAEAIKSHEHQIEQALKKDLNKSSFEAYSTEIGFTLHSIRKTIKKLKKWMKVKKVKTPFYQFYAKSYIQYEPLGTTLIIGPYNYPFHLVIEPLIGAIAAGNTAIVKPSEFTSHTETVVKALINATFDEHYVHCLSGDYKVTQELLTYKFDHIFFTGSTKVGQIVYEAAAKQLTPVTLELGGKSPTIVDETANMDVAARRIVFGKFINAGQTCIAPDYIYVQESVKDDLIRALRTTLNDFYHNQKDHYARIVNKKHFERLKGLIDSEKVIEGNKTDEKDLYISPTLMHNVTWEDAVMQEEIFGPVLPVLTYKTIDEVIKLLKTKDKPLALYLFTSNKATEKEIFNRLSFGTGGINDTLMQVANPNLPFGGVGASGIGSYHGFDSFVTFSNRKTYTKKTTKIDPSMAYPPYEDSKEKLIRRLLK